MDQESEMQNFPKQDAYLTPLRPFSIAAHFDDCFLKDLVSTFEFVVRRDVSCFLQELTANVDTRLPTTARPYIR